MGCGYKMLPDVEGYMFVAQELYPNSTLYFVNGAGIGIKYTESPWNYNEVCLFIRQNSRPGDFDPVQADEGIQLNPNGGKLIAEYNDVIFAGKGGFDNLYCVMSEEKIMSLYRVVSKTQISDNGEIVVLDFIVGD